jgi:hypothetical protein
MAERPLPETLDYVGEFGSELVLFTSFCNWLSREGLLRERRIRTYRGMRCFYDDLDCLEILEKDEARKWIRPHERAWWLPVKDEHTFDGKGRCAQHVYPDLRSKFRQLRLLPDLTESGKPLAIVYNKHTYEWRGRPLNTISLDSLARAFAALVPDFTVVYVRHGMTPSVPGFSADHNASLPLADREVLREYPAVRSFDQLYFTHRALGGTNDVNTFKNVLYSRCYHFISVQGGGSHHIALFSGSLLSILHRKGAEADWAYDRGYYRFMAPVPPVIAVSATEDGLLATLALFSKPAVSGGRVVLPADHDASPARSAPPSNAPAASESAERSAPASMTDGARNAPATIFVSESLSDARGTSPAATPMLE